MRKRGALEASRAFQQCDPESAIVLPGSPFTHQSNPEGYYGDKIRYVYKKLATINAQEMFILFFFFFSQCSSSSSFILRSVSLPIK